MICKHCGNELSPDAKFCGVCGTANDAAVSEQPIEDFRPQAEQPVQPVYAQPDQAQYAQPAQPVYAQPDQPQYAQPAQPQYTQPQYAQPVQQQYAQPEQPQYYAQQPQYGQTPYAPQYNTGAVVEDPNERAQSKSCLIFGILAIAFGSSFYLSFLGIIFGAIARSKAKTYMMSYPLVGRAKVGRILGTVGFVLGIVLTVFFTIWLIVVIAAAGSAYYYY